jgi:putative transcriptional regulator
VTSLRGELLVASPDLLDPNFRRTVVLVTEHSEDGAMGLVLNRRSDAAVEEAAPELAELVDPEAVVHVGGPVQPGSVVVLAEFDDPDAAAHLVLDAVGFVPADADIALLAASTRRVRVFAGYAGWGPGQLEAELDGEGWIRAPAQPDDVFAPDPDQLWSAVLRRKGGRFALVARMPLDPSLN